MDSPLANTQPGRSPEDGSLGATLKLVSGPTPVTWDEVRDKINAARWHDPWRLEGLWAISVLRKHRVVCRSNGLGPLGRPSYRSTGIPPTAARRLVAAPKDVSQRGPSPRGILWRLLAGPWKEYPNGLP